ncbi:class I SAM-dependent methyltransferase [Methanothrix soehngenii]
MEKATHILQTDAEHLPFQDEAFDCILSIQTVGYIDAQQFISQCNRILKCNGWLLFNEGNRHSYKAAIHRKIRSNTKFYRHSYSEMCSMLKDNGFQIKKAVGMNWLPIKRDSDNRLIPLASKIEDWLKLCYLPSISPWVFYVAQKKLESSPNTRGEGRW